jgi:hypothetical protein
MMVTVKAGGVWYEIADHLGHISLLCGWLEEETVEAQLVYCLELVDGRRDKQTHEKTAVRSCGRKSARRLFCVCLRVCERLKVTNRVCRGSAIPHPHTLGGIHLTQDCRIWRV